MRLMLKELRKAAGFGSAAAFAERIGQNQNTYASYEQGRRPLPIDVACDICDALGCSLDELMGRVPHTEYRSVDVSSLSDGGRQAVEEVAEFTRHRELAARASENGDKKGEVA